MCQYINESFYIYHVNGQNYKQIPNALTKNVNTPSIMITQTYLKKIFPTLRKIFQYCYYYYYYYGILKTVKKKATTTTSQNLQEKIDIIYKVATET